MTVKYAVLKLSTTIEVMGIEHTLGGAAGYIPVFDTEGEAEEAAQDGKYQIAAITLGEPDEYPSPDDDGHKI